MSFLVVISPKPDEMERVLALRQTNVQNQRDQHRNRKEDHGKRCPECEHCKSPERGQGLLSPPEPISNVRVLVLTVFVIRIWSEFRFGVSRNWDCHCDCDGCVRLVPERDGMDVVKPLWLRHFCLVMDLRSGTKRTKLWLTEIPSKSLKFTIHAKQHHLASKSCKH